MANNFSATKDKPDWYYQAKKFTRSDARKAAWQILDSFIPYFGLWMIMIYLLKNQKPYWIVLMISVLAAMFLVRIFIIFHDCCHNSFLSSPKANRFWGYVTGILTFTPFEQWQRSHAIHHGSAGNLDKRGTGDVWTMTVDEYKNSPFLKKLGYRLFRNSLVMFLLGPIFIFVLANRVWEKGARKREIKSVIYTNIALAIIIAVMSIAVGFKTYALIQFPIIFFAGIMGIWLFYVQHQFENVYWARNDRWDPIKAALEGSSFYKLPKILQWFSGNIGFHHIHHIRSNIPNYNLEACYNELEIFQQVEPLTFWKSLKCARLKLYDEARGKMVSFKKAY